MRTAVSRLELRAPRTMRDALRMLRDDGPLDSAGRRHRPLRRAQLRHPAVGAVPRPLGPGLAPPNHGSRATCCRSARSRRTPPSSAPGWCGGGCRCWCARRGRWADSRFRIAGPWAATSPTARPPAIPSPCSRRPTRWSCCGASTASGGCRSTEFYTGYRQSVRRDDELIVALEVPPVEGAQWFRKVGTRAAQAISKVVMAAVRGPEPRIALGSVAPTVIRLVPDREGAGFGGRRGRGGSYAARRDHARSTTCARPRTIGGTSR